MADETHTFTKSSNLDRASYNPETRTLDVTFSHGKTYRYEGVHPTNWNRLRDAKSAGGFHSASIASRHKGTLLDPDGNSG